MRGRQVMATLVISIGCTLHLGLLPLYRMYWYLRMAASVWTLDDSMTLYPSTTARPQSRRWVSSQVARRFNIIISKTSDGRSSAY